MKNYQLEHIQLDDLPKKNIFMRIISNANSHSWLSLVVAVIAMVLTQLKPLYEYFEYADVSIEFESPFKLSNQGRNFALNPHLTISNLGDATAEIKNIRITLIGAEHNIILDSISKITSIGDYNSLHPVKMFSLKPDQTWANWVLANNEVTHENILISNKINTLIFKAQTLMFQTQIGDDKTINVEIANEVESLINRQIKDNVDKIVKGNYKFVFSYESNNEKFSKTCAFELSLEDINLLGKGIESGMDYLFATFERTIDQNNFTPSIIIECNSIY